jgi:hypothetical protein
MTKNRSRSGTILDLQLKDIMNRNRFIGYVVLPTKLVSPMTQVLHQHTFTQHYLGVLCKQVSTTGIHRHREVEASLVEVDLTPLPQ